MSLQPTASQTVGPYFRIGLSWLDTDSLVGPDTQGERYLIRGRILDGNGAPVEDAFLEIWQADAQGRYAHPGEGQVQPADPGFKGFGRVPGDAEGRFSFTTIKPGPVPGPDGRTQAPHLNVSVFGRGILKRLATRLYFPGEALNDQDPILGLVPAERRATLLARETGAGELEWNVVLQGADETVFFEF